jgi:hypothetical protein
MKKETAVEWIESYLLKFNDISNNLRIRKAFEQAKEMEEKQLKEMYLKGIENYDPTFKQQEQ